MTVVYDGNGLLNGVDNVTVETGSGDLYVAEDGDDMQVVVITAEGDVVPVAQIVGEELPPNNPAPSEITGPVFSPDGSRLYFSSQRGGNPQTGITYEVTGPFRGIEPGAAGHDHHGRCGQPRRRRDGGSDRSEPDDEQGGSSAAVPIGIGVGVVAVVAGAVAVRRRRDA